MEMLITDRDVRRALRHWLELMEDAASLAAMHNWRTEQALAAMMELVTQDTPMAEALAIALQGTRDTRRCLRAITYPVCDALRELNDRHAGTQKRLQVFQVQKEMVF
jgi:hypothetical protein